MEIGQSIETCMTKYADFNGRAGRSEFWWFFLFNLLFCAVVSTISHDDRYTDLINLALLLPDLAVGARRLHDTGKSGWWQLLMLTGIGFIALIVMWASESDKESNPYGHPVAQPESA